MVIQDPILIRIMARWDWKVHLGAFLLGFLGYLITFFWWLSSQGTNPFDAFYLIGPLAGGFSFLFVDLIAFFFLARITKWKIEQSDKQSKIL